MFTEEQVITIVDSLKNSYQQFWDKSHTEFMIDFVSRIPTEDMTEAANQVQNVLWSMFSGGEASVNATHKAFTSIGQADACDDNWI